MSGIGPVAGLGAREGANVGDVLVPRALLAADNARQFRLWRAEQEQARQQMADGFSGTDGYTLAGGGVAGDRPGSGSVDMEAWISFHREAVKELADPASTPEPRWADF